MGLDPFSLFKLPVEESRQQIRRQVGRANVHPAIFIHLAAEETRAIGAFFADDLCPLDKLRVVDQQRASFAAGEVLGFMEGLRGHHAEGSQELSFVLAEQTVGVIFHHRHMITVGDIHDRVHFAAHTRIMHGDDRPGAGRERRFQLGFVQIKGIGPDVQEDRAGAAQDEGVDRRNEGKVRDDHLVAFFDLQQDGRHLERVRAGSGQQRLGDPQRPLQEAMHFFREGPVAGDMTVGDGFGHIFQFPAYGDGAVEINAQLVQKEFSMLER